ETGWDILPAGAASPAAPEPPLPTEAEIMTPLEVYAPEYNYNYTLSGPESFAPYKIYDDGQSTYFQFERTISPLPEFSIVDASGNEMAVASRVSGDMIAVDSVASKFSLRRGSDVVCVFNE